MKILVTGASGFIGSFIVEEAIRRGMETWAAVRSSSSRQFLKDERIHLIELDFSNQKRLEEQLQGHQFDYVVHAAGATKCLNPKDFYHINTNGTKRLIRALIALKMPLKKFVFIIHSVSSEPSMRRCPTKISRKPTRPTPTPSMARVSGRLKSGWRRVWNYEWTRCSPTSSCAPQGSMVRANATISSWQRASSNTATSPWATSSRTEAVKSIRTHNKKV